MLHDAFPRQNRGLIRALALFRTAILILLLALPALAFCQAPQLAFNTRYFNVHTANGKDPGLKGTFLSLDDLVDGIQMDTGVYIDGGPDVYIVPDRADYLALSQGRSKIVEFSEAFYSSQEGQIYIRGEVQADANFKKVVLHEYIHWYLDQVFELTPLWFHEGMAMLYANQLGFESYLMYIRDRFWGSKGDLFRMAYRYPEEQRDWQHYYLTSYFAIKYLKEDKEKGWNDLWALASQNYHNGKKTHFVRAFNTSFNITLFDFNEQFTRHSYRLAWQYLIIAINALVIAILPFIVLIIYARRRKRQRALPDYPVPEDMEEPDPDDTDPE